jgi:gas vesicle protein
MRSGDFMAGILVGVLIGGALGLLFAPEPGEDTRELVAEKARKWTDAAGEKGRTLLRRVEEQGEKAAD